MHQNTSKILTQNRDEVYNYLFDNINKLNTKALDQKDFKNFFKIFDSLESIYGIDKKYRQITPLTKKNQQEEHGSVGKIKKNLLENLIMNNKGEYISMPYISPEDGKPTLTVAKQLDDENIIALDFNLMRLLEENSFINAKATTFFHFLSLFIYALIGYSLAIFALILIFYALHHTIYYFMIESNGDIFQIIFKSIIALTLGLAIFDLAKNLLEHEVHFKERFSDKHGGSQLLINFLISIIIALSIESLMTVFKITLIDYKDIVYAFLLIMSISILLFALTYFYKITKNE